MVKPVFMKFSPVDELVWVCKACMKQKSSARAPKLGNKSEIILPDFPRGLKSQKGLAMFPDGPSKVTAEFQVVSCHDT